MLLFSPNRWKSLMFRSTKTKITTCGTLIDGLLILDLQLPEVPESMEFWLKADHVPSLGVLLDGVEETVDAGQIRLVGYFGWVLQIDVVLEVFGLHTSLKIIQMDIQIMLSPINHNSLKDIQALSSLYHLKDR